MIQLDFNQETMNANQHYQQRQSIRVYSDTDSVVLLGT